MATEFSEWREAALDAWEQTAPSYVRSEQFPLSGHLRQLYEGGATVEQFREALEIAFATGSITIKRKALAYAYAIVRRQLAETAD